MTDLSTSPVTRRTTITFKGRRILVTLRADDQIEFRLERLSESVKVPIGELMTRFYSAAGSDLVIPQRRR